MKGIAEITVRDKDGKIKLQRREHNTITTAHLEKVKAAIKNQKYARTMPETNASDFQGIWLHSEQLANLSDIEPVVLCGGTVARKSGVSMDYSQAVKSEIDGNNITSTWVWVLEKDINIKAISLHDSDFLNGATVFNRWVVQRLGNVGWRGSSYTSGSSTYINFFKVGFSVHTSSLREIIKSDSHELLYCSPLYDDDEYVYSHGTNGYVRMEKMLYIVDGDLQDVRSFPAEQFEGLQEGYNYPTCRVMPTAAADWLFVYMGEETYNVYKIPRAATEDQIPLVTTITVSGFNENAFLIVSNCAIINANAQSKTVFVAHADGTYTLATGLQMVNGTFGNSMMGYFLINRESNPTPASDLVASSGWESSSGASSYLSMSGNPAVHNTILNLSAPIAAETGDTLTITYNITVEQEEAPQTAFATDSWATIAAASADGTASTKYKIGDEKTITLTGGEEVTLQIWGFNHDDLADGSGKAGITIGLKELVGTNYMNGSNTNSGGWASCAMRTSYLPEYIAQLPSDLQGVIKTVTKKSGSGSSIVESDDQLFLFSYVEISGTTNTNVVDGEGAQYDYWKSTVHNGLIPACRIKRLLSGSIDEWWLRSNYKSNNTSFIMFDTSGGRSSSGAHEGSYSHYMRGICFGFCV